MPKRNILLIVLILLVAAAAGLYYFKYRKTGTNTKAGSQINASNQPLVQGKVEKKDVPLDKLPDKFPADIPLEKNAPITQNFNTTIGDNFQATRVFLSKSTMDENISLYKDYLEKNQYTVSDLEHDGFKTIIGRKNGSMLQIAAQSNQVPNLVTMTIIYSEHVSK